METIERRGDEVILTFRVSGRMPLAISLATLSAHVLVYAERTTFSVVCGIGLFVLAMAAQLLLDRARLSLGPHRLRLDPPGLMASREVARTGLRDVKVVRDERTGRPRVVLEHRHGPVDLIELHDDELARYVAARISRWLAR